jgi:hypothetical protein
MKELLDWTLQTIRDRSEYGWLEERRFEWVPLVQNCLSTTMGGSAVIIITDKERTWFSNYLVKALNKPSKNRPFLPFFSIKCLLPGLSSFSTNEIFASYTDMLDISFKSYIFWYIGRGDDKMAAFAKEREDSFLWVFDEQMPNSFYLKSFDEALDSKLISMASIFDKTIDAVMFSKVKLG